MTKLYTFMKHTIISSKTATAASNFLIHDYYENGMKADLFMFEDLK